ncbi:RIMS-binding protein 2-like isoform X12 [Puntigrus tetrazona]|uniref:RIMS-binding protein 2-like isoform X12 n=1 Tax=Puntigrus tetrazona TaxID=1606681 RepID=UPI001C890654|nr:RIMS-binding protein 2-like isoform X12 [Puntigrus tetrazona]
MMGVERQCEVEVLTPSQRDLQWVQKQLSIISNRTNGPGRTKDKKLRNEVFPLHLSPQHVEAYRLLEDRKHKLSPETAALYLLRQQHKLLETEISRKRKECEVLEEEVKKKSQSCQTLESELQHVLQEKARLNLRLFNDTQKAAKYEQVKSEYEQLQEALYTVTVERDCALLERTELQGKLENLEQVLKHMREAAERRQQLELEHEQALAVLSAKQQEIDLLQKAQVEAKKEHEGAVHLLENHLDSMQLRSFLRTKNTMRFLAKVRELEEKCRTQSEQFNLLSKELEKFRLQAGKLDILSSSQLTGGDSPGSPTKPLTLSQLLNGLTAPSGKGNEDSMSKISELIRPLQMTEGEKVELLSVKPTFLSRSTPSSPRRAFLSEVRPVIATAMDKELGSSPRSKSRYTGKVRLCVARYNYNPYDGPNEHPEAELPLVAGKYLYVYGTMDEDGFYEGELLDGQQGLVPSNFVDFVQDEELPSVPLLDRIKEPSYLNHSPASMPSSAVSTLSTLLSEKLDALGSGTGTGTSSSSGVSSLGMSMGLGMDFLGPCSNGTGTLDVNIDEIGEDIVPYPRRITLIKQLAKSVIISWDPPVVLPGWTPISGYNVLVDQEVRMSVPFGGRTKSLIEKLNLASCTHRISIQSVTERGLSDPLRCTLLVGKDVVVAPYYLRVENITQASAELTWMPSNSNYSHMIFLNEVEYDVVKPGGYKYHFYNLKPMTVYKIRVVARPHQMPWQLPLEQREKKEVSVEFCTQPAARHAFLQKQDGTSRLNCSSGPPLPPQDVQVQMGQTPGVLQIRWKPPPLTPTGTSNGANVIGYIVCTKGQKIAEIMYPTADFVTVELNRIQCLEAREVVVRTISAQGESQDSPVAAIPHNLLVSHGHPPHIQSHPQTHPPPYPQAYPPTHPQPHVQPHSVPPTHPHPPSSHPHGHPSPSPYPMSKPKLLPSARDPHAKEPEMGRRMGQPWDSHPRAPSPLPPPSHPGHTLEPPHVEGRRSPSPQRILPQPQGVPIPNTVARAMARQAAQRSAPNSRVERRNIFSERGNALHSLNSDEEEDGYDSPHARRRGASVDEFLRGSELGRHHHHYSHSEEYYTESSRGSDLSDIMEEDEEELYSEMQLEEGRRRSINSHNTLKAYYRRQDLAVDRDSWDLQREVVRQRSLRSHKRLHSIPEVAEEEPDTGVEVMGQRLRFEEARPGTPCRTPRPYHQDSRQPNHLSPSKSIRRLQRQRSSPRYSSIEERPPCWSSSSSRQTTKSPDSGLDCGSEEEGSLGYRGSYHSYMGGSPLRVGSGPNMRVIHSEGPVERRALAAGRKRTLTRQCSVEEDFLDAIPETRSMRESYHHYHYHPHHHHPQRRFRSEGRLSEVGRTYHRDIRAYSVARLNRAMDEPLILGSSPSTGRSDRLDHSGRRTSHGCPPAQRRPMTVPSIDGYGGRDRRSPDYYESEPEDLSRIFVAMFDYDPLSMSPNPDAAVEELPFKEGQIIKVFGEKDTDGFYRAEICGRRGLIPCNMVSEIQTDDDEMMDQLLKQGFLPLNTPIEKIVNCNRFKDGRSVNRRSRKSKRERNKRSGRQHPVSTRRMVALYDYDPRESSPNVDVEARYGGSLQSEEAELTFCAGDVITVFGEIDEDGFYYGELNGHKGLVPSNFLEEVPDDVEVYLTNTPSRHPQDHPSRTKNKRVPVEKAGPPRRSATPTVRPHIPGSGPAAQGPGSPIRRPRADSKKTGLLSKGKNLLKRLGAVK